MRFRKQICALVVALFSLQALPITARVDEGMWPFNNIPRAEIKKKYGFDVTDEWLKKVQTASVRFNNGGSGSFVSANGLDTDFSSVDLACRIQAVRVAP